MQATTIICAAVKSDGSLCGESAVVRKTRYEFDTLRLYDERGSTKHKLRATHYDIECPKCGPRTQSEKNSQPQG